MARAKKSAKSARTAKSGARKPAKSAAGARSTAKSTKSEVVYSDLRRDAIAWQLSRLR